MNKRLLFLLLLAVTLTGSMLLIKASKNNRRTIYQQSITTTNTTESTTSSNTLTTANFDDAIGGCGDITAYGIGKNREAISVSLDRKSFDITNQPKTIDISDKNVQVNYLKGDNFQMSMPGMFCNDVIDDNQKPAIIPAISGNITVNIVGKPPSQVCERYQIKLKLNDIVFSDTTMKLSLDEMDFKTLDVGWCPG